MYDFDYYKPGTLEDAVATLARSDEFKLLAGGMFEKSVESVSSLVEACMRIAPNLGT